MAGKTRILLLGVGRRARETLIPAIHCAAEWVELEGVCARSEREVEILGGRFRTTTRLLADVDPAAVDAVLISIGTRDVPAVLRDLAERGSAAPVLMIDTPVLEPGDLAAARTFSRFPAVLACEDNFALPLFVLARRLLDEGAIGRLRKVYLSHSGYRHHALAALQRLVGARPNRVRVERWNPSCSDVHLSFPRGVRAEILEPRRYDVGRTMVVGHTGFLADYPIDHPRGTRIGYHQTDGRYEGLTVDGEPVPPTELDEAFVAGLRGAPLEEPSLMGQMKIRGFMDLLIGLGDPASPARYPADQAIADSLSVRFAERLPFAPSARVGLLRSAARVAAPFVRTGGDES